VKNVLMSLRRSPLTGLSLLICVWLYADALYHRSAIVRGVGASLARPFFTDPSASPLITTLVLTVVAGVGSCAAIIALWRGEEPGNVCLLSPVLIAMAWWFAFSQLDWHPDYTS
jgi:hypothetical protein